MRFNREDKEETIVKLAVAYPKTFFIEPRHRLPLKSTITRDLLNDGFAATAEQIAVGVGWYCSGLGYRRSIQAGAPRLDLRGKKAGVVTEAEAKDEARAIAEIEGRKAEQRRTGSPVAVLKAMHTNGMASDCDVKKLDSPQPSAVQAVALPPPPPPVAPALAPAPQGESAGSPTRTVREALDAVDGALELPSPALRNAMVAAALGVLIAEAQRLVDGLQQQIQPGPAGRRNISIVP
jgi:sRNA-binding protein